MPLRRCEEVLMSAVPETTEAQMVSLTINGQELQGRAGQTILEVAHAAGIDIPTLCHDPRLEPYGACRMCLVEVEGARGPMAACGTAIREGMKVETNTEKIVKMRKFVLELLLTNHPLDCPVCEAAGDCRLQDYAYEYLVDMVPWGWRAPAPVDPGEHPHIAHFGSRCILCGRCVRICREVMGIGCWGYLNRGYDSEVDTPYRLPLKEVECVSCGQCVSTCPVGAIVGQRTPQGAREWQTRKTVTTCSYCADGCRLVVHEYRGRVVKVASETERGVNQGNLCVKGRYGIGYTEAPDRVTVPLVRNPKGELEQTSWENALSLISDKIKKVLEATGGRSIGAVCGTHCTNEAAYLLQKLMRTVIGSNNIDSIDSVEQAASEEVLCEALGLAAATNPRQDMEKADVILVVGANLTHSHPVLALQVVRALRLGKTVIVIDPCRTELAAKATMHLAVKPDTDLAALRVIIHQILELGLGDAGFIGERTEGLAALEGMLKGLEIGVEAGICDVDADLLRAVAVAIGQASATVIIYGTGVTRGPKAAKTVAALVDLALVTGNVGRPGAGIIPLRSGANSQGVADMGVRPDRLPGGTSIVNIDAARRLEGAWGASLAGIVRGACLKEMLTPAKADALGLLYVMGADPALAVPDEKAVRSALEQAGFVVVQDSFLTDTAEYADVVLPAAVAAEDDGTFTNGERFVQRVRPAVKAPGQCRQSWLIVQSVANGLGAGWSHGSPADVMREIAEVIPTYGGISYERLESGEVQWPCPDPSSPGTAVLHVDGFNGGKAAMIAVDGAVSGAVTDNKFPLALVTGTVREHHGTGVRSRRAPGLKALVAEAALEMNAADAARAKVSDGDRVRVVSQRGGEVETVVQLSTRVPVGVVFMPSFSSTAPVTRLQGREGSTTPAVSVERL
jgi:predicted molibdopterin-dependent oxidoreductase YjgC